MHSNLLRFLGALILGLWLSQAYSKPVATDQAGWDAMPPLHIKRVPVNLREKVQTYDVATLLKVAQMFEHGRGVAKDLNLAAEWYWRAERMGNKKAMAWREIEEDRQEIPAVMYRKGVALRASGDEREGLSLISTAATRAPADVYGNTGYLDAYGNIGYVDAHRDIGIVYFSGKHPGYPKNLKSALFHLKQSAIHGKNVTDNHIAFGTLAKIYDDEEFEFYDPEQSYYFMLLASKLAPAYETAEWAKRYDKITDQQKLDIQKKAAQWRAGIPFWDASITLKPPPQAPSPFFDAPYAAEWDPLLPVHIKQVPPKLRKKVMEYDIKTLVKVAEMFEHGSGVPKDLNLAAQWYLRVEGMGAGADKASRKARAWLKKEMEREEVPAIIYSKALHLIGDGSDSKKGLDLIRKAAEAGYPAAHSYLGALLYASGAQDSQAAIALIKKGAIHGENVEDNHGSFGILAQIYGDEHSKNFAHDLADPEQAYYYMLMASRLVPSFFTTELASYYDKLSPRQKNQLRKIVAEWKAGMPLWEAASPQASPLPAAHNRTWDAMLPIHAKRVPADLHKKVMAHDVTTWLKVAQMFEHGQGVAKDPDFAAQWYWRAELMGSKQARAWREKEEAREEIPAVIYGKGAGLGMFRNEQKAAQALALIRKAAKAGYAPAHLDLGVMYYKGQPLPKDTDAALTHLKQAAIHGENIDGNHIAFAYLGEIYGDPQGAHFNPQQAYYFMLMANQLASSYETYDRVDRYGELTPRQMADIKKRAAQWKVGEPFWEAAVK